MILIPNREGSDFAFFIKSVFTLIVQARKSDRNGSEKKINMINDHPLQEITFFLRSYCLSCKYTADKGTPREGLEEGLV